MPDTQPDNDLLAETEQKIESQLQGATRQNYLKIVVAGMHAGLSSANGRPPLLASLKGSKDPIHDCAVGAVNLVLILRKQAKGIMPLKALVPAATTLMLKALAVAEKMGLVEITPENLAQATRLLTNTLFHAFRITPQMMQAAAQKIHSITQDPGHMEAIKRAAGVVKSPDASEPTEPTAVTGGA